MVAAAGAQRSAVQAGDHSINRALLSASTMFLVAVLLSNKQQVDLRRKNLEGLQKDSSSKMVFATAVLIGCAMLVLSEPPVAQARPALWQSLGCHESLVYETEHAKGNV